MSSTVTLSGLYSYQISPLFDTVTLDVTAIENSSLTATTGTLRLELWLTTTPWNGSGSNSGWEIATDQLSGGSNGTLPPDSQFDAIVATVPYLDHPPAGSYYVTLAVAEYTGANPAIDNGYVIDTSAGFPDSLVVASNGAVSQGSAVPLISPAATFAMTADGQTSITEGQTETFTLNTTGIAAGSVLYYSLTGVTAAEVVGGDLTGTITVGSNGVTLIPVTLTSAPGQGLTGQLTDAISATPGGAVVATASEPLTETPAVSGQAAGGITAAAGSVITKAGQSLSVASLFSLTAGSGVPLYLDVTVLDRNEYPGVDYNAPTNLADIDNNSRTGHLTINGTEFSNKPVTAGGFLAGTSTDAYEESISFSYVPSLGKYYNATYGYLNQLSFLTSSNQYENSYISIYGSDSSSLLATISPININAASSTVNSVPLDTYFSDLDGDQYYGTVDVVTRTDLASAALSAATPDGICATAQSFVGKIWSDEGCWTLASNISAQSGASLNPVTAYVPAVGTPITPAGNGEWILVYYGGSQANPTIAAAEAVARPGDIVTVGWQAGGGHITTVVSGFGTQAQVVDNEELVDASNSIVNSANDGISSDIVIQPAHSLDTTLQEDDAIPATIAVYRLDTPTISISAANSALAAGASLPLASLFSVSDAAGAGSRPITEYRLYDSGTGSGAADSFLVDGSVETAHSAASAITVTAAQLASLALQTAGDSSGTDTVTIDAYNGAYWGDPATLDVTISAAGSAGSAGALTAAQVLTDYAAGLLGTAVAVSDSAADIGANLDGLQLLAAADKLSSIGFTDSGVAALSLTTAQVAADSLALASMTGSFSVTQSASGSNLTISGVANALGNSVVFSGDASQYSVTPAGDGINFSLVSTGSTDHLSHVQALQFADLTEIVAPAPGSGGVVTGGNITELYGAVFGRLPDAPGLDYYEKALAANPALTLLALAEDFLQSPEYTGNSAHAYAQTAAGEAQFITDSYDNLLNRAPESGAIPYYQKMISSFTQGLTPGTAAYAAADLAAHATVLVDFSASGEFLGDVQITAKAPASAGFTGHWLVLI